MATKDDELLQALDAVMRQHSFEVARVIAAHREWKDRLARAVETGHCESSASEVERDDRCELGRWIHGADVGVRAESSWRLVRDMHDQFHREAAEIVTLIHEGQLNEARMALEPDAPFGTASRLLLELLESWRAQA